VPSVVPQMEHLQDVVKLHTFVLGHLGALLFGMFGFDLRFALVAFDLVSDSIWCEGVRVGVGARGGSTWAGGDYLRGALGWERRANLRTTNKARSHTQTQAQATQPLHRGPPVPILTALQHEQLVNAAKAKCNGLNPQDGLKPAVEAKLSCPLLRNWRSLKELENFSGSATIAALGVTAAAQGVSAADHADADPLTLSGCAEAEDRDEKYGHPPLSSTFVRGKNMFQDRPFWQQGRKCGSSGGLASAPRGGLQRGGTRVPRQVGSRAQNIGRLVKARGRQFRR